MSNYGQGNCMAVTLVITQNLAYIIIVFLVVLEKATCPYMFAYRPQIHLVQKKKQKMNFQDYYLISHPLISHSVNLMYVLYIAHPFPRFINFQSVVIMYCMYVPRLGFEAS